MISRRVRTTASQASCRRLYSAHMRNIRFGKAILALIECSGPDVGATQSF